MGLVILLFYDALGGSGIGLVSCLFYGLFNLFIGVFSTGFFGDYWALFNGVLSMGVLGGYCALLIGEFFGN